MKAQHRRASVAITLLAGLVWLCLTTLALAHASLTAAEPPDGAVLQAAPARLSLSFSEPVSPLTLKLVNPDGEALELGDFNLRDRTLEITPPGALGEGSFVLTWRVVSEDGHPVAGSTVFSIGAPSRAAPVIDDTGDRPVAVAIWLARLLLYAGLFFGIGGVFASSWFVRERAGRIGPHSPWLTLGLIGTVLSVGLQGLDALGAPLARLFELTIWKAGASTSFGRTAAAMVVALVLAAVATGRFRRALSALALVTGAMAMALSGHASAAAPQWLTRPAVFLHALTIAVWAGALIPLGLSLRQGGEQGRAALARFSRFIPHAVAALAVAGVALAVIQVEKPGALISTAYGKVLLVKLALLAPLFLLAAVNRWFLTGPAERGEAKAVRHLVRAIAVETMLVIAILAVAATWRFTPPPRALAIAAAQPASTHIHTEKAMAEITVTPGHAGPVDVSVILMTGDFGPLDAKDVTFVFANPAAGIEAVRRKAFKPGDGTWRVKELILPLGGPWTVRLDVLVSDFEMTRLSGEVTIRP